MFPLFLKHTFAWIVLNLMDTVSTLLAFQVGLVELNPLPAAILEAYGLAEFIAWKWFWVGWVPLTIYALRHRFQLMTALRLGCFILNLVVIWNCFFVGRAIGAT